MVEVRDNGHRFEIRRTGERCAALTVQAAEGDPARADPEVGRTASEAALPGDPVFRRRGRTAIPITIGGTAKAPKVGLDVVRAFTPAQIAVMSSVERYLHIK